MLRIPYVVWESDSLLETRGRRFGEWIAFQPGHNLSHVLVQRFSRVGIEMDKDEAGPDILRLASALTYLFAVQRNFLHQGQT